MPARSGERPASRTAPIWAVILAASWSCAEGADQHWTAGDEGFSDGSRWTGDGEVPGSGDNAFVNNGGTVRIGSSDPAWSLNDLRAGEAAGSTGFYVQSGGTVTAAGWMRLGFGNGATGGYTLGGGVLNANNRMYVGAKDGSQAGGGLGVLTITGGTLNQNGQYVTVGARAGSDFGHGSATGRVAQSGGTFRASGEFYIGNGDLSPTTVAGVYELSGTGSFHPANWFVLGRNGASGVMEMSGGSVTKSGSGTSVILGIGSTGRGTIHQTGGTFTNIVSSTWFGENGGSGFWNLSGDAVANLGKVYLKQHSLATGEFNLDGGTLSLIHFDPVMSDPAGTSYSKVRFNGGTLKAAASDGNFLPLNVTTAEIGAGGAIVDSNGFDVTFDKALSGAGGDGGLTKKGTGMLQLSGANSYSGPTVAEQGSLILNGSINAEAPEPRYGGTIGMFSCRSLSFGATARMKVEIDSNEGAADKVRVAGNVNLGGARLEVTDLGGSVMAPGTKMKLIEYGGEISGGFSNVGDGGELTVGANTFAVSYDDDSAVTLSIPGGSAGLSFEDWLIEKIAEGEDRGAAGDPDGDSRVNLLEFALDGDPSSAADDGKMVMSVTEADGGGRILTMTLPVREGAVFSGEGPLVSQPVGGMVYVIEASTDLMDFEVLEIAETSPVAIGLPGLSPGWEYRCFQVATTSGGDFPKAFLRVRVTIPAES